MSEHDALSDGRPVAPTPAATAELTASVVARRRLPDRHEQDLEFLARSATEWVELPADEDILAFAGRRIWELVGDSVVLVSSIALGAGLGIAQAVFGAPETLAAWRAVAGDPVGESAPINDQAFQGLTRGRLMVVPGGLDVVTLGLYSAEVARKLERAIGFRQACAMGFTLRRELYGSVVIIAREHTDLPDPRIIEAFVNQATVALQRQRAMDSLRESERRFRELADQLPQTVVETDVDGNVTFANRHALQGAASGATADARGVNVLDGVAPKDRERVAATLRRVIEGETVLGAEYTALHPDGSPYEVACYASPIERGGHLVGIRAIAIDITERKQAEAARQRYEVQLQHAAKLESLAVLAGGLAHDYNNLLVAVLGNAELALTGLKAGTLAHERVHKIQNAARRAAELTDRLLDYSGGRHFVLQALALNEIVVETRSLLEGTLARAGAVRLELASELPAIEGDAAQVRQVVSNLLTNAAEAVEGRGGTITVRTGVMRGDHPALRDAYLGGELLPEDHVFLEVADTGCGMDEATRLRVFDPFFTTKFPGRGLGLAAVLGIVRTHRGAVHVDSEVDRGTTFRVLFRVAQRAGSADANADER
ncbi:MAG: PAS domain S-box protein [Deltaproteobacteria bacterium]|nr:PAS domain S-box protein [Deltaproteobacteria bacterium]